MITLPFHIHGFSAEWVEYFDVVSSLDQHVQMLFKQPVCVHAIEKGQIDVQTLYDVWETLTAD